ncbi:filamentous hemagglutinin N-terminal domain-containing protein, partial [Polynucleobacter sp. MWH-Creno-3A4]|uniref:beta strand repeat-containing protein n=1 Tax=Polynucleobacter sp. MWH-Creno-3A4 TaxID=1855886 RepID=UPI001C0AEE86
MLTSAAVFANPAVPVLPKLALPTNGQVVAGNATISQSQTATTATMNVNQTSQRAVINWDSFNVGKNATVNFNQPNASAVTLNRITSATPTMIEGAVRANGQVIFVNPNGVTFARGSQVDAAGVVATTMNISNKDFMEGKSTFKDNGTGAVINEGKIKTNVDGGYIALLAPEVRNDGYLIARKGSGTVAMASGEQITLDFKGNSLISVKVDVAAYNALIENKRVVEVNGGLVVIAAGSANQLMATVIKNTGRISASSAVNNGGVIELVANTVTQAGKVTADSQTGQGGQINIVGNDITIAQNSKTTATGATAGGQVNVGLAVTAVSGGTQVNSATQAGIKANADSAANSKQLAKTVTVETNALIDTSATQSGNGGSIAIWSEVKTTVAGILKSMGGALSGNGGFIETSSKGAVALAPQTQIVTTAANGKSGTWLLDPIDLIIDASTANLISAVLANSNVSIAVTANSTVCPIGSCTQNGTGSLTIASGADILKAGNNYTTLTLSSSGIFNLNANISGQNLDVIISSSIAYLNVGTSITASKVTVQAQTIYAAGNINTSRYNLAGNAGSLGNAIQLLAQAIYVSGGLNLGANLPVNGATTITVNGSAKRPEELPSYLLAQNADQHLNRVYGTSAANDEMVLQATPVTQTNSNVIYLAGVNSVDLQARSQVKANGTNGGSIYLSAPSINTQAGSVVQANGNNGPGGVIAFSGDQITVAGSIAANGTTDGGAITLIANNGDLNIQTSTIQTNGSNGRGGSVGLSANNNVTITGSAISATGYTQGGQIKIGNDASKGTLPFALSASLDQYTSLNAAQQTTDFTNQNGGLIETSGATLNLLSSINAGRGGMWLLDPNNVTISAATTSGGTLPSYTAGAVTSYVKDADIQTQINAGTSVTIIANGTITQSTNLSFAPASGTSVSLTYDTRTGTAQSITLTGTTTNTGAGNLTLNYLASGQVAINGAISSTSTGKINVVAESFYATNTTASATGANIYIAGNITTKGGFIALDGTGGSISATGVITKGTITNGTVTIASATVVLNTTSTNTTTLTSATTGGNFTVTTSQNLAPNFGPNGAWYFGGSVDINSNSSGVAQWGYVTNAYNTTSPIAAVGNINITVNNTSTSITANKGVIDITSTVTSYAGSINLTAITTGSAIAITSTAALSAAKGITITGTSATAATIVNLGSSTITNAVGDITITGNNSAAGANTGITSTGAITQNANGGNITFTSNNIINQTGAITLAANTNGIASSVTYDATSGNKTANITGGNVTVAAGSTSDVNYVAKSAGSGINPGALSVPGYVLLDNTYGAASGTPASGYITNANSGTLTGAIVGVNVNSAITATKNITLNGASQTGYYSVSMTAAISTSQGSIAVTGSGINYSVYSSAAGTLTASSGSLTINGSSTTGQAVQLAGAITTQTGITINGTGTTASTIVTAGAMTLGAGYVAGTSSSPSVISNAAGTSGSVMGVLSGSTIPTISSAAISILVSGTSVAYGNPATAIALLSSTSNTATYIIGFADATYSKMVQVVLTSSSGFVYATESSAKYNTTLLSTGGAVNLLGGNTNILSLWNGSTAGGLGTATVQTLATSSTTGGYGAANLVLSGGGYIRSNPSGNIIITANNTAAGGNIGITQSGAITNNVNGSN